MTTQPTPAQLAELKADLQRMSGLELVYAALTDSRLDWLDDISVRGGPELDAAAEWEYSREQADYEP